MQVLEEIHNNLRPLRHPLAFLSRWSLNQRPPSWMPANDLLTTIYRQQSLLLRRGLPVWGALVQANSHLFRPGLQDHPAQTICSPHAQCPQEVLLHAAARLYQLKNTTPADAEERALAAIISDDMKRTAGYQLPESFGAEFQLLTSSFMVFRAHLPGRTLRGNIFPLLIHPDIRATMIVPSRFWPQDYTRFWLGRQ